MSRPPFPFTLVQCSLVALGAVLGSVGTLAVQRFFLPASGPELSAMGSPPSDQSPLRDPALNRRGGDLTLKRQQILDANDPANRIADLRSLGREAAEENIEEALALAETLPNEADRREYLRGLFAAWGAQDALAAATYARDQIPASALQSDALSAALGGWGAKDPRAAYIWAEENLTGPQKEAAIHALVTNWAGVNPREAASWFVDTGSTSQPLLAALVGGWASKDPKSAADFVESLPSQTNRETGRLEVARLWAAQDPQEAVAHFEPILTLPVGASPEASKPAADLAATLANIWATNDPAAAAKWIDDLPPGAPREQAAGTLASVWASSDIQSAAAWSESLTDAGLRANAIEHLATTWGAIEPDKALAWLETQPESLRASGIDSAYNSWAITDSVGLKEWIDNGNSGAYSDVARSNLGDVYSDTDMPAAMDLALQMTTPEAQAEAAQRYFKVWNRQDHEAAQDWLGSALPTLPAVVASSLAR